MELGYIKHIVRHHDRLSVSDIMAVNWFSKSAWIVQKHLKMECSLITNISNAHVDPIRHICY